MMLLVQRTLPDKTRFTENLNIYLSSPAPNSPLQNPSNFGATASHWLLYFLLFFFFLILTGWMRGALCVGKRLYILYLAADEVNIRLRVLLLILKYPHTIKVDTSALGVFVRKLQYTHTHTHTHTHIYIYIYIYIYRKILKLAVVICILYFNCILKVIF